jgi:hypothetical protein
MSEGQRISRTERARTLEAEIDHSVANGWRLHTKTATEAHLVKGEPVRHFVHLFFAIVTLGLWLIVWIPLTIFGGEKHRHIAVDEEGKVTWSNSAPFQRATESRG